MKTTLLRKATAAGRMAAALAPAVALALCAAPCRAQEPLFVESFEERSAGVLHEQNAWSAHRQNDTQVQGAVRFAGSQAALVATNAAAWREFDNATATNVWIDFYAFVRFADDDAAPSLHGSAAAAFFVGSDGTIRARSNATWVATGTQVEDNRWHRFTVNLDYGSSNWALYVAGDVSNALAAAVATNLQFASSSTNTYFRRFRIKN